MIQTLEGIASNHNVGVEELVAAVHASVRELDELLPSKASDCRQELCLAAKKI